MKKKVSAALLAASLVLGNALTVLPAKAADSLEGADPYASVDFETYLAEQGFPESYKTALRGLHELYPNWVFEAQHTGLDWSEALAAESTLGKNLVPGSSITSWKSTDEKAYDWETGEWVEFDSGGWVAASPEIIAYYMDARNFLDEVSVFQFLKQSYNPERETKTGIENMTAGSFLTGTYEENGTKSYTDALVQAAEASNVNPYVLVSMIFMEQGRDGGGASISGTEKGYEGYYNYFNIGAYKTGSMSAVERGLWYAKGSGSGAVSYNRPWDSRTKSIIGGAIHYGENYVNQGQDTLYLKKYNVQGNNLYNHQYMTNVAGAATEGSIMSEAYTDGLRTGNLTFRIPIYENMPETACEMPTGNDTPSRDETGGGSGNLPDTGSGDNSGDSTTGGDSTGSDDSTTGGDSTGSDDSTTGGDSTGSDDSTTGGSGTGSGDSTTGGDSTGNGDSTTGDTTTGDSGIEGNNPNTGNNGNENINGNIELAGGEANVGDTVIVEAIVKSDEAQISNYQISLSYDPDSLEFVSGSVARGAAGVASLEGTLDSPKNTVQSAVMFKVLKEGEHEVGVSEARVTTADEELLTMSSKAAVVKGTQKKGSGQDTSTSQGSGTNTENSSAGSTGSTGNTQNSGNAEGTTNTQNGGTAGGTGNTQSGQTTQGTSNIQNSANTQGTVNSQAAQSAESSRSTQNAQSTSGSQSTQSGQSAQNTESSGQAQSAQATVKASETQKKENGTTVSKAESGKAKAEAANAKGASDTDTEEKSVTEGSNVSGILGVIGFIGIGTAVLIVVVILAVWLVSAKKQREDESIYRDE